MKAPLTKIFPCGIINSHSKERHFKKLFTYIQGGEPGMYLINLYRRWRLSRRLKKAIEVDKTRKNAPLVKKRTKPHTIIH